MTRNQKYEQTKRAQGLTKLTVWVPGGSESEFKLLAKACVDNRDLVPVACRCARTGRLVFPDR